MGAALRRTRKRQDHYNWEREIQARSPVATSHVDFGLGPKSQVRTPGLITRLILALSLFPAALVAGFYYLTHRHPTVWGVLGAAAAGAWVPDAVVRLRKRYKEWKLVKASRPGSVGR